MRLPSGWKTGDNRSGAGSRPPRGSGWPEPFGLPAARVAPRLDRVGGRAAVGSVSPAGERPHTHARDAATQWGDRSRSPRRGLGGDTARSARVVATQPADGRPHAHHLTFLDVDGLGPGAHLLLQRGLPTRHPRQEVPVGAGQARLDGVVGDLARHRPAHREGHDHRRGDLGRVAAAVPGAQRLRRGDLPHLLLQPARRRQRRRGRHALRGHRGHPGGRQQPAHGRAARPRLEVFQQPRRGRGGDRRPAASSLRPPRTCRSRSSTSSTRRRAPPTWRGARASRASTWRPRRARAGQPRRGLAGAGPTRTGETVVVDDLERRFPDLPTGCWSRPAGHRRPPPPGAEQPGAARTASWSRE